VEHGWIAIGQLVKQALEVQVYTVHPEGYVYTQPIWQWHHRGVQEVFEYELENGAVIRATPEHQFMTIDGQMLPIDRIFAEGLLLQQIRLSSKLNTFKCNTSINIEVEV
jgi:DNA polymerase III subunit alpha